MGSPTAADLLTLAEDRAAAIGAGPAASPDIVSRELDIEVAYRTGSGEVLRGVFGFRVPSIADRRQIGRIAAALRGGVSPEALSEDAASLCEMEAYLMVCVRSWPDWCRQDRPGHEPSYSFDAIEDPRVLRQVYEEAASHHARFLDAGCDLRAGQTAG